MLLVIGVMDDLIPIIMFCPDYFKKKWDISSHYKNEFVWTALKDDAKMGIVDQHKKEHIFIFKKGAKIIQWIEDQKLKIKYDGLKKIKYSND